MWRPTSQWGTTIYYGQTEVSMGSIRRIGSDLSFAVASFDIVRMSYMPENLLAGGNIITFVCYGTAWCKNSQNF
jgi:hypothetical protein